jgi:acetylornithine aminotransferase
MNSIFEKEKELFLPTYSRVPIEIVNGTGVYLFDKQGNKYLDFFSGLAVNALGYAHPRIIKAVTDQIAKFGHLSNNYITEVQIQFAEKLLKYSVMDKIFLSNSGTEAIEGVLKLIRLKEGQDKKIFSLTNSFHGRTFGALSLTAREKYQKGFEPLLPNISHINFNDVNDLSLKVDNNTAAIIIEFIQGEGGINEVSVEFISKLDELRNKYGYTLVADAIQDGIGRSGKAFVHNYYDVKPDIIVTAKAIGGGLPLGAFLTTDKFKDVFSPGKHGTTFGGNPVSCAAGLVVLEEIFENGLVDSVYNLGLYFKEKLLELQKELPEKIKEVRGKGFILGVELFDDCTGIVNTLRENKILANCTNQNILRILPPLIATQEHIDFFLNKLKATLKGN